MEAQGEEKINYDEISFLVRVCPFLYLQISDLYDLLTGTHDSHLESRAWAFPLFAEAVQRSSDAELKENCSKWTGGLVRCLQVAY